MGFNKDGALILFSNRTGMSVDDGNLSARKGLNGTFGTQFAALPLVKPFVLGASSSSDVPVLLLNQPNKGGGAY